MPARKRKAPTPAGDLAKISAVIDDSDKTKALSGSDFDQLERSFITLYEDQGLFCSGITTFLTATYSACRSFQESAAKLLRKLSNVLDVNPENRKVTVWYIVENCCMTFPDVKNENLREVRSSIPFIADLHRLGMFRNRPFLSFAKGIMKRRGSLSHLSAICLFEIVKAVNQLLEEHKYPLNSKEAAIWQGCMGRLRNCKNVPNSEKKEIESFLKSVSQKGGWDNYLRTYGTEGKSKKRDSPTGPKLAVGALPKGLGDIVQQLPSLVQNVTLLSEKVNHYLHSINAPHFPTKFRSALNNLLTLASDVSQNDLAMYAQLINLLKKEMSTLKVKENDLTPYIRAWAMQLRKFENIQDVEHFRRKLPLINMLYIQRLTFPGIFKYYATEIANGEDETSMLALYEVIHNVDTLSESRLWKYKPDEAAFYEECCCRLAMACQTSTFEDGNKAQEISSFLASVSQKGGWHRTGIARYLKQSQVAQEDATTSTAAHDEGSVTVLVQNGNANGEHVAAGDALENATSCAESAVSAPMHQGETTDIVQDWLVELEQNPENWTTVTSKMEAYLGSLTRKTLLRRAATTIWDRIHLSIVEYGRPINSVYVFLLENIREVRPANARKKMHPLFNEFTSIIKERKRCRCDKMSHLADFSTTLYIATELYKVKLVDRQIFEHFVHVVEESERSDESLKTIFLYEIVRCVDLLIDERRWNPKRKDRSRAESNWLEVVKRLKSGARQLSDDGDREEILRFVKEFYEKGGISRTAKTPTPEIPQQPAISHANFCSFLETDFIQSSRVMETVAFLKSYLLTLDSPVLFAEAVASVSHRLFEMARDRTVTALAVRLCSELGPMKSGDSSDFNLYLAETCVKFFNQQSRQETEESLTAVMREHNGAKEVPEVLVEKYERLETSIRQKYMGCARLIASLFIAKLVSFNFFLSFVDCLLSIRTDSMLEALLEVFSIAGGDFEGQVRANLMEMWWTKFIDELSQMSRQTDASVKKRAIISELSQLNTDGWPQSNEEKLDSRKMKMLMLELTPALTQQPLRYAAAVRRVRSFFDECPQEHMKTILEVVFGEFQTCLGDLAQCQQQVQSQMPLLMYPPYQPWPSVAMDESTSTIKSDTMSNAATNQSSAVPRVLSLTSATYDQVH